MTPNDSDPKRRGLLPQTFLTVGGFVSLIAGLTAGSAGCSDREAMWRTGLIVLAGLCFVAGAIHRAADKL
jgi:hypothetical protein